MPLLVQYTVRVGEGKRDQFHVGDVLFEFQLSIHRFGRGFVFLSCLWFYKKGVLCLVTRKMEERK